MGMSSHVIGIRAPDSKWQRMKAIWDACDLAEVNVPDEVLDYFEGEEPNPLGVEVELNGCVNGVDEEGQDGFVVDLSKLPKDITHIKFYNLY